MMSGGLVRFANMDQFVAAAALGTPQHPTAAIKNVPPQQKKKGVGKTIGVAFGIIVALFVVLMIVGSANYESDPIKRIEEGCRREFGFRGEGAVQECKLHMLVKHATELERDRLNRASR
ncbi:MAG: hypothetical protein QOH67_1978 [Hyphomicrobiales bacterium]|jgi:hypothetical protein|nr:hypothetical protein [Hyphomicrobiales bacterium]